MGVNIDFILDCLNPDDDEEFWKLACKTLFEKPETIIKKRTEDWPVYLMIGCCSRWLSSEPKRFSDTHGVPLPSASKKESYSRLVMPEYDWSVLYFYDKEKDDWAYGREPFTTHYLYRVALPAKTVNLNHAVVLTHWEPMHPVNPEFSDYPQLYTFRKIDGKWNSIKRNL